MIWGCELSDLIGKRFIQSDDASFPHLVVDKPILANKMSNLCFLYINGNNLVISEQLLFNCFTKCHFSKGLSVDIWIVH